jgi:predicted lipoprotein with Yx(FWY)xxD motif
MFGLRALPLVVVATLAIGPAAAEEAAKLTVEDDEDYDEILADGEGRSLYVFDGDTQGQGDAAPVSACRNECAAAWPPFTTTGDPVGDEGVTATLIGTLQREDGSVQVTYNGWPLYYFSGDKESGDTEGEEEEAFGSDWYLLDPDGETIEEEDDEPAAN